MLEAAEEICTLQRINKNKINYDTNTRDIDTMMMNTYGSDPSCPPPLPMAVRMELRVDMPCSIRSPPDRAPTQRRRCSPSGQYP